MGRNLTKPKSPKFSGLHGPKIPHANHFAEENPSVAFKRIWYETLRKLSESVLEVCFLVPFTRKQQGTKAIAQNLFQEAC